MIGHTCMACGAVLYVPPPVVKTPRPPRPLQPPKKIQPTLTMLLGQIKSRATRYPPRPLWEIALRERREANKPVAPKCKPQLRCFVCHAKTSNCAACPQCSAELDEFRHRLREALRLSPDGDRKRRLREETSVGSMYLYPDIGSGLRDGMKARRS